MALHVYKAGANFHLHVSRRRWFLLDINHDDRSRHISAPANDATTASKQSSNCDDLQRFDTDHKRPPFLMLQVYDETKGSKANGDAQTPPIF